MTNQFTTPELNAGFQLDTSLLTPEQLEHALQVFQARGINQTSFKTKENNLLCYKPQFKTICWLSESNLPLIDYPTLCRGSVQLDSDTCALFSPEKLLELYNYANPLGLVRNYVEHGKSQYAIFVSIGNLFLGYAHVSYDNKKISPEEFEVKLKGIYPVVRETTETVEKPKYFSLKEKPTLIVEYHKETEKGLFSGTVIQQGNSAWHKGMKSKEWHMADFEPCDYTEQDTPVTEQPRSDLELRAKKRIPLEDKLHAILREAIDEVERLEQENAQLKDEKESIFRMAANFERENKQLVSDLSAANQRIAELEAELGTRAKQNAEPKEPVYDAGWLWRIVKDYNSQYSFYKGLINFKNYGCLSPKDSAPIIVAGLAKHLNPLFEADPNQSMYCIQRVHEEATTGMTYSHMIDCAHIFISEQAAQKAISILTEHFPEVLKNYLG